MKKSIKFRLMILPLFVVFLSVVVMISVSSIASRASFIDEMTQNGFRTLSSFEKQIQDVQNSLRASHNLYIDRGVKTGNVILNAPSGTAQITNDYLKGLAKDFDIEKITWYGASGNPVFSTNSELLSTPLPKEHPVFEFMKTEEPFFAAAMEKDTKSEKFMQPVFLKAPNNEILRLDVNTQAFMDLVNKIGMQSTLASLAESDEVLYASYIGLDYKIGRHSDLAKVGGDLSALPILKEVIEKKERRTHLDTIPETGEKVLNVYAPLILFDNFDGVINLGLSTSRIDAAITKNIAIIAITGLVSFLVLATILYTTSRYAIYTIRDLKVVVIAMASGDFSQPLPSGLFKNKDEFGEISRAISAMQENIKQMILRIMTKSNEVAKASEDLTAMAELASSRADEISKSIDEIASGANNQARDTESGVVSITEMEGVVHSNTGHVNNLNSATSRVSTLEQEGAQSLSELVEKARISKASSENVHAVILNTSESAGRIAMASEMIKNIADQTNLLALNAAIEAARAGDAGKGFAVVADEIRKLAEQSNKFTKEISDVIVELVQKTEDAVQNMSVLEETIDAQTESVEFTRAKFTGISHAIEEMKGVIHQVSSSSQVMQSKTDDVMMVMQNLSAISEENAASTEQSNAAVEEQTSVVMKISKSSDSLAHIAADLKHEVAQFKID